MPETLTTRKEFVLAMAGVAAALPLAASPHQKPLGKLLIFVAHPDDEYMCAGSVYRLVRECGWTADQVIVTDGESGSRYSSLAETFYGVSLSGEEDRARLASVRKQEAIRAGKVLGIREHYFLDQKDLGFSQDPSAAGTANWDRGHVRAFLANLLQREQYTAVVALLPTAGTHAHHRLATLLALETIANLPEDQRPLIFGVDARAAGDHSAPFDGLPGHPTTRTAGATPYIRFDRSTSFGYHGALSYQIVVNWVIAEHKSQGLFQTEAEKRDTEQFWLFEVSGPDARRKAEPIRALLDSAGTITSP